MDMMTTNNGSYSVIHIELEYMIKVVFISDIKIFLSFILATLLLIVLVKKYERHRL